VYLNSRATTSELQFKLRADYGYDRTIMVRVPNFAALRTQQEQLMAASTGAILDRLEGDSMAMWASAPAEDADVPNALVRIVRDQVAGEYHGWPASMQWVITADILNGLNWPELAAKAIRAAEELSPQFVKQPGVQQLAASTGALAGDRHVFAHIDTPAITTAEIEPLRSAWLSSDTVAVEAGKLATKLEEVPALQFYGLSLKGDVKRAAGDVEGARAAYQDAALIRPAPSVTQRLETTGGWRGTINTDRSSILMESEGLGVSTNSPSTNQSNVRSEAIVIVEPADPRLERAVTPRTVPDRAATVVQPTPEEP
jgi:hypothetical protein